MKIENLKINEIKPYKNNARKNDKAVEIVKKSIKEFGFRNPIILDKNNEIIAGHTRLKAAQELEMKTIPCIRAEDLTEDQVKAFRIMDNKSTEFAEWDQDLLKEEFTELDENEFDLELTGFDLREVGDILDDNEIEDDGFVEVDAYERAKNKTKIQLGEIYLLGDHRLMCGDATEKSNIDKLMAQNKADMVFTDPPYNLNFKYPNYDDNKNPEEYSSWCKKWFKILKEISEKIILTNAKQKIGLWYENEEPRDIAIWIHKNGISGAKISNLSLWEPILFYGKFKRDSRVSNLFEYNLKRQETGPTGKEHSCPKQLDLISDIVKSYSNNKENVLDIFGGSGTTLIACEQLNRKCFMMEIDPVYCQVIIDRWEKFTQQKSVKIKNGK